jgi:hypothetical protein
MAEKIDDERASQIIVDPLVRKQVTHIEEIAWMLTIERGDNLAGVEVGKGHDVDFSKAKRVFDRR